MPCRAILDGKREVIATFKCLGAPAGFPVAVYLIEIMVIAALGIAVGLVARRRHPLRRRLAALRRRAGRHRRHLPGGAGARRRLRLPHRARLRALSPRPGARGERHRAVPRPGRAEPQAAAARLPRGRRTRPRRARRRSPSALPTSRGSPPSSSAPRPAPSCSSGSSPSASWRWRGARRGSGSTVLRLAVGNIHRPGALTPAVVLSLGLGLTLLVALVLIDGNFRRELFGTIPQTAPSFFMLDIQGDEAAGLAGLRRRERAGRDARDAADAARADHRAQRRPRRGGRDRSRRPLGAQRRPRHHLFGDAAGEQRDHRRGLVAGGLRQASRWSRSATRSRAGLRLEVGDTVTVNVLGREVTARDRQPPHHQLAVAVDQLGDGLHARTPSAARPSPASPPSPIPTAARPRRNSPSSRRWSRPSRRSP